MGPFYLYSKDGEEAEIQQVNSTNQNRDWTARIYLNRNRRTFYKTITCTSKEGLIEAEKCSGNVKTINSQLKFAMNVKV